MRSSLITKLLEIQGMHDYTVRTSLILNIPNHQHLTRHNSDARTDITFIVNGLAEMRFLDGKWALTAFIDNALARTSGTTLSIQLQDLQHRLETEQHAKEQAGEIHEELVEKESSPNNTHEESEEKGDQSDDVQSALLQQVQMYHSQIEDVQKLFLKAQEPLNAVCKLFKTGKGIKQDQCDKVISHIYNLRVPLLNAHALYDKALNFQGTFSVLSFHVKVVLNDIDDQIDELTSNLHMFRNNCPLPSIIVQTYQSDSEREKIESERKKISEHLDSLLEMLKEINNMLNKFLQGQQVI